jgi:hypothetical protein
MEWYRLGFVMTRELTTLATKLFLIRLLFQNTVAFVAVAYIYILAASTASGALPQKYVYVRSISMFVVL